MPIIEAIYKRCVMYDWDMDIFVRHSLQFIHVLVCKLYNSCFQFLSNGEVTFPANAPDTVTDFVANAYAIHPVSGLGVAPVTSNVNRPCSVKRGFNYCA